MGKLLSFFALFCALAAMGGEIGLDVSVSTPQMAYLNRQLEDLATRMGTSYDPLSLCWEAGASLELWDGLGIGAEFFLTSGGIKGRRFSPLSCFAVGAKGFWKGRFSVLGKAFSFGAGLGIFRTSVEGVVSGVGWGLGVDCSLGGELLRFAGFEIDWKAGGRYLPIASISNSGETISPLDMPAVDFTGFYLGISFGLRL